MPIQSLTGINNTAGMIKVNQSLKPTPFEAQQSFGAYLKDAIQDVNSKQVKSDELTQKLIMGENVDLHNVMITAQKASIALNATMEVRNKVVEAYQEIIRMPV
ncbi:flagellar hook-basal body complex protein FliE [Sporosarcina thermotolerans]|uniref:Flagellar hook-basal body complex protein FliE n=2 Tax=Sporosarcina thermotolerans TaxID=633404 RepID=A0AAW9A7L4_9BACL|nr:flagellar hook-basal body complex protein FliE [Sporosarcina thermotolerans]MDW0115738.1 flagellar hook-basal body complex protein FliE [Sporosarcina thermotolerans]WHT47008.1 flagellar hook-basal body complex protein FliE [Sporosarcina thermotolerans]